MARLSTVTIRYGDHILLARAYTHLPADRALLHLPGKHDQSTHGSGGGSKLTGQDALKSVPKGLFIKGSLTAKQRKALQTYETGWSMVINGMLRDGDKDDDPDYEEERQVVRDVDSAMDESVLPTDIEVHRGMLMAQAVFGDAYDNDLTGFAWRDNAYGSTTANAEITNQFLSPNDQDAQYAGKNVRMRALVPAGTKALATSTFEEGSPTNGPQAEITLQRGVRWTVVKDNGYGDDGVRNLDVRVDPPGVREAD